MDRILYSSDRAEAPAHSLRQEKRARQKDPFEVERAEFSRIAHPVIGDDSLSGVTDETFYREDHHEDNIDKLVVAGAIAYILMPIDLIPDFIPFIGEVDDVFLMILAIDRLISHAGKKVVADHWMGDPEELGALNLERILAACAFFLPKRMRRRLRTIGRV